MFHSMGARSLLAALCVIMSSLAVTPDECETADACLDVESIADVSLLQGNFQMHASKARVATSASKKQAADGKSVDVDSAGANVDAIVEPSAQLGEKGLIFFQMEEVRVHADQSIDTPVEEKEDSGYSLVGKPSNLPQPMWWTGNDNIFAQAKDSFHSVTDGNVYQLGVVLFVFFVGLVVFTYMFKRGSKVAPVDLAPRNDFLVQPTSKQNPFPFSYEVSSKKQSEDVVDLTFAGWNANVFAIPLQDGFGLSVPTYASGDKGGAVEDVALRAPCGRQTGVVELVGPGKAASDEANTLPEEGVFGF